jgi:hypothetical protein
MLSDTLFEVLLRKKVPFAYYLWQLPGHKATISEPGESVRLRVPIGRPPADPQNATEPSFSDSLAKKRWIFAVIPTCADRHPFHGPESAVNCVSIRAGW